MKRYYCSLCIFCFFLSGCDDNDTLMVSSDISHNDNYNEESEDNDSQKESEDNDSQKESEDNSSQKESEDNDSQGDAGCEPICDEGFKCENGDCLPICTDDLTYCNGECLDLEILHLADCSSCAENFCDSDNNLINGCEIDTKAFDTENCGGCGVTCKENEKCDAGSCVLNCQESETICGDVCVNLAEKHLATCDQCVEGYSNCDEDMSNGCETAINSSDDKNCGACGKTCGIGESCTSSQCKNSYNVHRRFIVGTNVLTVHASASDSAEKYGDLPVYTYIKALGEKNGWFLIEYNKKAGWVNGAFTIDAGDQYAGRKAVDLAETYLYTKTGLCTFDHLSHPPILQNFTNLSGYSGCYYGYENNCANFTTSILVTVGLASVNEIGSWETKAYYCEQGRDGYHIVDKTQAKPGDIWYKDANAGKHIELVMGYHNGNYVLIGSNNFNASNYSACANTYSGVDVSHYQRVSYDYRSDGYICTRQ